MDKGYFSMEAILAEEDRVPVVFNTTAASLGFLDPGCKDEDLPAKSRVVRPIHPPTHSTSSQRPTHLPLIKQELPLWLAQSLEAKNMVRLELPKHYTARFREDLLAG